VGALALAACGAARPEGGAPSQLRTVIAALPSTGATTPAPSRSAPAVPARVRTPCDTNKLHRFVYVSLGRQQMWLCAERRVALSTPITSGMTGRDTRTPTGRYRIQGRNRDTVLTPQTGETYSVKYWIPFDAPSYGFHDSSWQTFPYGSEQYRIAGSHGCVHMPLAAIRYLYNWADIGTSVRIAA
jgi:lipoprotein-anchoring transpeptidase ErfK/SrfK